MRGLERGELSKKTAKTKEVFLLSVSNTVTEMAFYYKSPFTPYVFIISIL